MAAIVTEIPLLVIHGLWKSQESVRNHPFHLLLLFLQCHNKFELWIYLNSRRKIKALSSTRQTSREVKEMYFNNPKPFEKSTYIHLARSVYDVKSTEIKGMKGKCQKGSRVFRHIHLFVSDYVQEQHPGRIRSASWTCRWGPAAERQVAHSRAGSGKEFLLLRSMARWTVQERDEASLLLSQVF